jgi:RNA polymerase sigma factor (sigma-70 family)
MTAIQDQGAAPDRQLLEAFLARRDEAAFAELVRRHGPMVLNVCRGVLGNLHDAEDAFQATFLVLAQKAASIRRREAVAGWLCGVAYHLALKVPAAAKRRRNAEEQTEERAVADPLMDMTLRELHQLLLEELQYLPEKYRLPLVLCYLEGRTQTEAARQLGWLKDVFRGRLNRGRTQLRARLTRRGLALTAGLFASTLTASPVQAALPAVQVETLAKAVLKGGDLVSARVASLAEGAIGGLIARHGKIATLVVLALGLVTAGTGLWAQHQLAAQAPVASKGTPADTPPQTKKVLVRAQPEVAIEDKGDTLAVSGRVLDPEGKPFAGAKITLWWHEARGWIVWHHPAMHSVKPYRGATSGADGRFDFTLAKSAMRDTYLNADANPWHRMAIIAAAPGYGPAWLYAYGLGTPNAKLQLVKDDVPILGRVRDLQGRLVAGATVRLHRVEARPSDHSDTLDRDAWAGPPAAVTTDEQGRFRLTGAGRDRSAVLIVSGPRIETKIVRAATGKTEDDKPIEVIAGPSKPIEGTVRAKDTGKPLAGVWVYGNEHANCNNNQVRLVRAVTDDKGHYRLQGMPKTKSYELTVYAAADQSYLGTARTVADSEGLKPIAADFTLRRGIPVKFRLLDKRTGRPVRGQIQYDLDQNNPFYVEAVYGPGVIPSREFMHIRTTDQDGYIRFIAYPGPCVIYGFAGRENGHFLRARLDPADEAKGYFPLGKGDPANGFLGLSHGYRRIDYPENAKEQTFDILFDSGVTLKGLLVGPDSQPVKGAVAYGLSFDRTPRSQPPEDEVLPNDTFLARGLDPDEACTLSFVQRERKLLGHVVVRGNEKQPATVRLRRWGALTGRLVDVAGKPLADVRVSLKYPDLPRPGMRPLDKEVRTDRDGRFRVAGLLPDLDHELILSHVAKTDFTVSAGEALKKVKTREGEVKELGDIAVKVVPAPKEEKKNG